MAIPIYEGTLPPAVAEDFTFYTVLTARGRGFAHSLSYDDYRNIPNSAYTPQLRDVALDDAKSNLSKIVDKLYSTGQNPTLVADVRVIRENKTYSSAPGSIRSSPLHEVVLEAIGYKRRE